MELFHVVHPLAEGIRDLVGIVVIVLAVDGLAYVDDELSSLERSLPGMRPLLGSRPDLICTGDVDGNERYACLDCDISSSVLHGTELTVVCTCAFREDEADVALFDFLLSLDETSDRVAVTVYRDAASDLHDESSERTVVSLEVSTYECAHPLEVSAGKPLVYKHAVSEALVVTCNDVRVVLGEVISADTLEVGQDGGEEEETYLREVALDASFYRVLLIKLLVMISALRGRIYLVFSHK